MTQPSLLAHSIKAILLAGASSSLMFAGAAFAQDQDVSVEEVANTAQTEQAQEEKTERIQVTGSRIRIDSFANETPIDIISADEAAEQGIATLGDLLRTSTVAAGSSQVTSALTVGYVTNGGSGAETISLRGLGAGRTLVLLNGRRAGPAGTRGAVSSFDMNALPISAIERVEILKDGASSVYGSDAVAGVINIITKKGDSKSVTVDVSQPFDSGGERQRINASIGETFDNGSVRAVIDYNVQKELKRGDREFYNCTERGYIDADGNSADPIDPRTGQPHCNDAPYGVWLIHAGATNDIGTRAQFDYDGFMTRNGYDSINDTATAAGDFTTPDGMYYVGYDKETDGLWNRSHPYLDNESMVPETKVLSALVTADYDLSDDMSAYAELLFSQRKTKTQAYRQFWTGDISWTPAAYFPGYSGNSYMLAVSLTDHYGSDVTVDYTRFVAGIEGYIGDWKWDVNYQRSHNDGEYKNRIIYRDSMLMGQDALLAGGCAAYGEAGNSLTTEYSNLSCVDVPWADPMFQYGAGNRSAEVTNFLFGNEVGNTIYKQQTIEAYITGDVFEMPAGAVGVVVGAQYQTDEIDDTPGFHSANGNSWGLSSASRTAGDQATKSVYAEVRVPLLVDAPLAETVDVTGSARYSDVDTYGDDTTFKVGLNWAMNEQFRIRASRGTSFRSPALFELYLAGQSSFAGQLSIDPCYDYGNEFEQGNLSQIVYDNCQADGIPTTYDGSGTSSATVYTSGGAETGLAAETSVAEGVGFVWTSPENTFAFSVDYYKVDISNQIYRLGGSDIVGRCYTSENFGNEPLCDLFTRNDGTNGDYSIDEVFSGYVNIANQRVRGVDYNFTYQDEFDFGNIRVALEATNQIEQTFKQFEDSEESQYVGDVGTPEHVARMATTFSRDNWSVVWTMQYVGNADNYKYYADGNETTYRGTPVTFVADVDRVIYHHLSGNMTFADDQLDVTVGIANLFDEEPPMVSGVSNVREVGNAALYSQYDNYGRRIFANVTYNF